VIVFHALARREMVFDQSRANSGNLIRANRGAHATAADGHAAHDSSLGNRTGEWDHEIGIVVLRVQREGAEVSDFMARGAKLLRKGALQLKSAMIGTDSDMHFLLF